MSDARQPPAGDAPRKSPQERWKCACPAWTSARECIEIRYNHVPGAPCDERCECACHEEDEESTDD